MSVFTLGQELQCHAHELNSEIEAQKTFQAGTGTILTACRASGQKRATMPRPSRAFKYHSTMIAKKRRNAYSRDKCCMQSRWNSTNPLPRLRENENRSAMDHIHLRKIQIHSMAYQETRSRL